MVQPSGIESRVGTVDSGFGGVNRRYLGALVRDSDMRQLAWKLGICVFKITQMVMNKH